MKILHVVHGATFGGVESLLLGISREINNEKLTFDYIVHSEKYLPFHEQLIEKGGEIFHLPPFGKNPFKYINKLIIILRKNKYDIIHIHTGIHSGIIGAIAFFSGVKVRICHAHNSSTENIKHLKTIFIWKILISIFCNELIACTSRSAKFWFLSKKFTIFQNSISIEKFSIARNLKNSSLKIRKKDDSSILTIGHAGRFTPVKNHIFIINLARSLIAKNFLKFQILLAGDGPLYQHIHNSCIDLIETGHIRFLGPVSEMAEFWSNVDIMILPSLNEGFPLVFLEAQAAGCLSLISDEIIDISESGLDNFVFCKLSRIDDWINPIVRYAKNDKKIDFKNSPHDTKNAAKILESIYNKSLFRIFC